MPFFRLWFLTNAPCTERSVRCIIHSFRFSDILVFHVIFSDEMWIPLSMNLASTELPSSSAEWKKKLSWRQVYCTFMYAQLLLLYCYNSVLNYYSQIKMLHFLTLKGKEKIFFFNFPVILCFTSFTIISFISFCSFQNHKIPFLFMKYGKDCSMFEVSVS